MVNSLVLLARERCSAERFYWEHLDGVQGWRQFEGHIAADERSDLVAAYHKRLTSADTAVRNAAVSLALSYIQTFIAVLALECPAALENAVFCKSFMCFA